MFSTTSVKIHCNFNQIKSYWTAYFLLNPSDACLFPSAMKTETFLYPQKNIKWKTFNAHWYMGYAWLNHEQSELILQDFSYSCWHEVVQVDFVLDYGEYFSCLLPTRDKIMANVRFMIRTNKKFGKEVTVQWISKRSRLSTRRYSEFFNQNDARKAIKFCFPSNQIFW